LVKLEALSLMHRFPDGAVWVHRWTAEGLAGLDDVGKYRARSVEAGRYRWWRVQNESHSIEDALEALRNFLAGHDFDAAVDVAGLCFNVFRDARQSVAIAALAAEILETLPDTHSSFAPVADEEAQAHLSLGFTDRALARYQRLLSNHKSRAEAEPDRADYQRDLSVSYERMGDLYRDLGQGEAARQAYQNSLAIRERLAQAEPDRADYQRDLVVSLVQLAQIDDSSQRRELLLRASSLLEALKAGGKLAPVDEPMIAALDQLLSDTPEA
jgi:tetratricopeptide (TPR) repeat protein